jgi:hypothetical protein
VYAPGPRRVARAVRMALTQNPEWLQQMAENARRLARPDAVWTITDEIWEYANRPRIVREEKKRPIRVRRFRREQKPGQRRKRKSSTDGGASPMMR